MKYPIFKATDKLFIMDMFRSWPKIFRAAGVSPDERIEDIRVEKISPEYIKDTCLVRYKIIFRDGRSLIIRGRANKDKSNKRVWNIMNFLYRRGFNNGDFIIARPFAFIAEINLLLYEEAAGESLSAVVERGDYAEIERVIKRVAGWLAKLHAINFMGQSTRRAIYLNNNECAKIFRRFEALSPEFANHSGEFLKFNLVFLNKIWRNSRALIHNDFYPGNIIINKNKISIIDFDASGIGNYLMDLATLLTSLEFPIEIWPQKNLNQNNIKELQIAFLKSYSRLRHLNYNDTKISLQSFFAKAFFNQIYINTIFAVRGWRFINNRQKKIWKNRVAVLVEKIRRYF